jgi:NAD(P)-dependent dehydrogenase (short-subunit alcohol dehydrogenase family)
MKRNYQMDGELGDLSASGRRIDMATWVVTGANRGIGLEICRQLKQRGEKVFAACRQSSPELAALGVNVIAGVELTSDEGPKVILKALGDEPIDVLVNNAAILVPDALEALDFETLRRQYDVNAIGPLRMTQSLLPRLGKGSKIAFVSSRAGSIGDNASGGLYGYRMSKAALNMAGVSMARDLAPRGILVVMLHPGFIRTGMTGNQGNDDPPVAAKGLIARIDELTPSSSGKFLHANGQELPW